MTKQLAKITIPNNGTWKIIMNDCECNKFRVYYERNGHKKLIQKYCDLASCFHCILQQTTGHMWRMTDERVERLW